ncbi:hypothetical protein HYW46_04165 [Candidatus Daviesbacteria bacterium]|nr:hypothetical protein [Candidatus Daviesbacteria bacterium]
MPEIEITEDKRKDLRSWADGAGKRLKNIDPNGGSLIWDIAGEPFVMHTRLLALYTSGRSFDCWAERYFVLCSDKHAETLEQAGIIELE